MADVPQPRDGVVTQELLNRLPIRQGDLKQGGGGGNSGGMEHASKDYVDSAVSRLEGKIEALSSKLDHMPSTGAMLLTAGGTVVSILTLGLAILAFAGDRFDGGIGLADQRQQQLERDRMQDETLKRLDAIMTRLDAQAAAAPED